MALTRPLGTVAALEAARFTIRAFHRCASCEAGADVGEAIALGNAALADRLTLATLCQECGAWSIVRGDVELRPPTESERRELLGDYRATLLWTEWRTTREASAV